MAGSAEGEMRFTTQQTDEDITELEDRMAEVLQFYSQQLWVERTLWPKFSQSLEDWPDFKCSHAQVNGVMPTKASHKDSSAVRQLAGGSGRSDHRDDSYTGSMDGA